MKENNYVTGKGTNIDVKGAKDERFSRERGPSKVMRKGAKVYQRKRYTFMS